MKNYHTSNMERQPILEKLDSIVKATEKFESLVAAAKEKEIISSLETDIIVRPNRIDIFVFPINLPYQNTSCQLQVANKNRI